MGCRAQLISPRFSVLILVASFQSSVRFSFHRHRFADVCSMLLAAGGTVRQLCLCASQERTRQGGTVGSPDLTAPRSCIVRTKTKSKWGR
jgi:hypothetical protein